MIVSSIESVLSYSISKRVGAKEKLGLGKTFLSHAVGQVANMW